MANWAYVENDQVEELHEVLPESWRNISNLYASENDLATLKFLGWYPVTITTPDIDNNTQGYGDTTYVFDGGNSIVIQNTVIVDLPAVSSADLFAQQRAGFMQNLRSKRDSLLSKSDWSQTVDIVQVKGSQWAQAWATYRQALRDLPGTYTVPPLDTVVDSSKIIWPVCGAS